MTADRTNENCASVRQFLIHGLGGEITARDPSDLSVVDFHSDQPGIGKLHIGEQLLADTEPEDLIRRLTEDTVLDYLKAGQSVQVLHTATAVVPSGVRLPEVGENDGTR
jgi:hypothetical protein